MVETNLLGAMTATEVFLDQLRANGGGDLGNVSSVAGRCVSFLITFLTVLDGTTDGSPFGYGFFPGALALVTWAAATSIATYRSNGNLMPVVEPG